MKANPIKTPMGLSLCLTMIQVFSAIPAMAVPAISTKQADLSNAQLQQSEKSGVGSKEDLRKLQISNQNNDQSLSENADSSQSVNSVAGGNSGVGGGDVATNRLKMIINQIGRLNGNIAKPRMQSLLNYLQLLIPIPKSDDDKVLSGEIYKLILNDLRGDIEKSKYVLSKLCLDEYGVEKSATTEKVDLVNNPNVRHPDICINVRKLALENASEKQIMGLLLHEHARHFGFEDTDDLDFHPLADYAIRKYIASQLFKVDVVSNEVAVLKSVNSGWFRSSLMDSDSYKWTDSQTIRCLAADEKNPDRPCERLLSVIDLRQDEFLNTLDSIDVVSIISDKDYYLASKLGDNYSPSSFSIHSIACYNTQISNRSNQALRCSGRQDIYQDFESKVKIESHMDYLVQENEGFGSIFKGIAHKFRSASALNEIRCKKGTYWISDSQDVNILGYNQCFRNSGEWTTSLEVHIIKPSDLL